MYRLSSLSAQLGHEESIYRNLDLIVNCAITITNLGLIIHQNKRSVLPWLQIFRIDQAQDKFQIEFDPCDIKKAEFRDKTYQI